MVTLLRPTGRACNSTDQLIGTVKLHWPGADNARTPGVRPLGPGDPAIPARYLEMSPAELDALFDSSPAGAIPQGRGKGTIIALPGTEVAKPIDRVLGFLVWRGKNFHPQTRDLKNLLTPLAIEGIRAEVSHSTSWVDGRECVLLDYSRSSRICGWIRDEIREVAPGVYLGVVWGVGRMFGGRRRVLGFALTFPHA
jgi:hypothetical protein